MSFVCKQWFDYEVTTMWKKMIPVDSVTPHSELESLFLIWLLLAISHKCSRLIISITDNWQFVDVFGESAEGSRVHILPELIDEAGQVIGPRFPMPGLAELVPLLGIAANEGQQPMVIQVAGTTIEALGTLKRNVDQHEIVLQIGSPKQRIDVQPLLKALTTRKHVWDRPPLRLMGILCSPMLLLLYVLLLILLLIGFYPR